jgi:hypothetical protein
MRHKKEGPGELRIFYKVRYNFYNRPGIPDYQVCSVTLRKTPADIWLFVEGEKSIVNDRTRMSHNDIIGYNFFHLSNTPEEAVQRYLLDCQRHVEKQQKELARAQESLKNYETAMNTEGAIYGRTNEADTHPPYRRVQQRSGSQTRVT